jgi:hypothetical protein
MAGGLGDYWTGAGAVLTSPGARFTSPSAHRPPKAVDALNDTIRRGLGGTGSGGFLGLDVMA